MRNTFNRNMSRRGTPQPPSPASRTTKPGTSNRANRRAFQLSRRFFAGSRILLLRRAAAVMLALLAGMLVLQPRPGPAVEHASVLTLTRDLPPGHVLTRADVAVRPMPTGSLPSGSLREPGDVAGRMLSGGARCGEVLTDIRLVGPELTRLTTGTEGQVTVPVRLAQPEVVALLHPGRKVDIVTAASEAGHGSVLAEHVPVIAVRPSPEQHEQGGLVLVGLPQQQAATVAAASVVHSLTVTLR